MRRIKRLSCRHSQLLGATLALMVYLIAGSSMAADLFIDGTTYTVNSDVSFDNEYIGNLFTGALNQTGGANTAADRLFLGYNSGSSGTYNLSGGSLSANNAILGNEGTGTFTQTGGTNAENGNLFLGYSPGSSGIYNLNGGTNAVPGILFIGYNSGSSGTYNLTGGSLSAGFGFVGYQGVGLFNQRGGIISISNNLQLGYSSGSSGTYNLSGGSLFTSTLYVGKDGNGIFNQSGGSTAIEERSSVSGLYLGFYPGRMGTYNLSGGSLSAPAETIGVLVGGLGVFNQSGGANAVTDALALGYRSGSSGTYNLRGGSLLSDFESIGFQGLGTFNQSGGSNTLTGDLILGDWPSGSGTYNLSGGGLVALSEIIGAIGSGTFTHSGGTNTADSITIGSNGTYALSGAGVLSANNFTGNLTNGGTVNPNRSVGAMTVNGSYTQTASGNLKVEVASSLNYDQLNVFGNPGTASLNGRLTPTPLSGYIPQNNQVFPGVVTATGGVTGVFSGVGNLTPTLTGQALYLANRVDLLAQRNYTNPYLSPLTGNQLAVGHMLNSVADTTNGDLNSVLSTLDNLPDSSSVRNAYQQVSPDKAAALPALAFAGANLQKRMLSRADHQPEVRRPGGRRPGRSARLLQLQWLPGGGHDAGLQLLQSGGADHQRQAVRTRSPGEPLGPLPRPGPDPGVPEVLREPDGFYF